MRTTIIPLPKTEAGQMPPKTIGYSVSNRRGPSVGKSSWKPGGTAHPVERVEHRAKNNTTLIWYRDTVTGKRVKGFRHDARTWAGRKSDHIEHLIRNLAWKATKTGLTVLEVEKLQNLALEPSVGASYTLQRLVQTTIGIRSQAGHVVSHRNVPKVISGNKTRIRVK